ncbi:proteasome regulatory particle subunit [Grosmannia clavigera kw1407]|uniref:Proteasome regulatory particle subunit n=1 Tax=Grosmannia clavigera (strain kw1407 / UAMH 11150) TaxID=655863 RepID=F0XR93_GROCL|nr:proteasome regulatory particle subunit [Grosmannia clavigera kw1407]EFW99823.1 proteasome regulatory particle subunit [Grosmannia clavigera kw1407]
MSAEALTDFLDEQRDAAPTELQGTILEIEDLWERKLWHQLTDTLIRLFDDEQSEALRLPFFKVFVLKFADKINQLKFVDLALKAAETCEGNAQKLAFLESVAKKVDHEDSQDAFVFATIAVARAKLMQRDFDGSRAELDRAERVLETFDAVEQVVHAAFYDTSALYYQGRADFGQYYRNALLYLACVDVAGLDADERHDRAFKLSLAALVSPSIYNFGELLLHPILDSLAADDEDDAWLRALLFAFNRGDLRVYERLADRIAANSLLHRHSAQLRQKIYLAALTEAVFRRPPHARAMSFAAIAAETRVQPDEIEHLVMKALSLGLLRGTIDQVDEVAHINWVQPKVLDMKQIANLQQRLAEWGAGVNQLGNWIEQVGQDVWAA